MGLFPQQFIDDLRLQANIVQVVSEYVPLKKAGTTYKGLCPFHSEKTPSFNVNPEKGFFHCFGCGAGGDVFKFLELHEKLGFQDSVKMLAAKFGLALPERSEGSGEDDAARRDSGLRESMLKIHEVAAAYFVEQLAGPAGARARQQLKDRGVTPQTITDLGHGFAPQSRDGLKGRLLKQGFAEGLLLQSGLILRRDNGDVIDRFRNRLMIPICRDTGSVIAFGGRSMDADQNPKYLNSPETPIYSKSRTLYGMNLTKAGVRKLGYAVLVEGYFDFAQVYQSQAAPVVASCGTALTSQQAQLLRRFTTKIVLSFDPMPRPGRGGRSCECSSPRASRSTSWCWTRARSDTFIGKNGADRYRENCAVPAVSGVLLDQAAAGHDFGHDDSRRQFLARCSRSRRGSRCAARDQFADRIAQGEGHGRGRAGRDSQGRRQPPDHPDQPSCRRSTDEIRGKGLIWGLIHNTGAALEALAERGRGPGKPGLP